MQAGIRIVQTVRGNINNDFAFIGEFDRIFDQIEHDLPQAIRIPYQPIRRLRRHPIAEFETFGLGAHGHHSECFFHKVSEMKRRIFQLKLTGFNF